MAYQELFAISMNDVLKDSSFVTGTGRMDKGGTFKDMFSGVFENVLPSLMTAIFPDSDMITEEFQKGWKLVANPAYVGGRADFEAGVQQEILVPDIVERQISALAETFNEEFFKAITPEGATEFEAFGEFAQVVQNTNDFMEKFNYQMDEFSVSAADAYHNIQAITSILMAVDADVAAVTTLTDFRTGLNESISMFDVMKQTLMEVNATVEEQNRLESAKAKILGAQITGVNAGSLQQAILSGGDVSSMIQSQVKSLMAVDLAEVHYARLPYTNE
jgi:hypothetical protein